ncbi:tRNA uridine-5-carboxymethylaminomethyl(34) synthesis GTPase MnmE [Hydrogenoanaerobacterium sp.]|uniref:tRNA uridine-5-carboxymethylaminomethyl(34) synthesis GTPase MnmE n=1 Tax=Hydrogenoanaerobacterium sp. TaxID=2953763 RepID=UPI00289B62F5|nr:tRNA uridine-5-carboxymethylaminomethyl(34) synthesis GTPase MnmE [Hydrogenoanaerobacterium sp.]
MSLEATTIAAISTPLAVGGIGVIRISGKQARQVASKVFSPVGSRQILTVSGYTAIYGRVFDQDGDIDDAVVTVFIAPRSYTGEDVVEISCHGGLYLLQRTLRAVLDAGAVPAAAGEFTKRAFLNGKLSLTQAEAVMDLISAQGEQAARSALSMRDGKLFRKISGITSGLLQTAAHLSAWVDYPEEEIPEITDTEILTALTTAKEQLATLLATFDVGRVMKEGVETAIVGRPNVGKSTLMNLLAGFQRSIVTDIPGTTRDIVEDTVNVGGAILRLADTAGLRETDDVVESVGVELARKKLETAGLVLAVFDSSDLLSDEDMRLIEAIKGRPAIAIVNKSDLEQKIDLELIKSSIPHLVYTSAQSGQGVEELANVIAQVLGLYHFDTSAAMIANERQRICAERAKTAVDEALAALNSCFTFDAVNVCIDDAIAALLELTGERASEAVVNEVFHNFCVGK